MIAGIFHEGSGLGDQLFRYITVRTLAEDKKYDWCMVNQNNFKGFPFLNPEMSSIYPANVSKMETAPRWFEKDTRDANGLDIRSYDPEINFVQNETTIDGSFEDSKYWGQNLDNINEWLAVEPLNVLADWCVIGFRGGEYYADPELGLPKEYFYDAMAKTREINHNIHFQVHTDDPQLAKQFFPDIDVVDNTPISHSKHTEMGRNWRSARYAKYAIIPNSAFFILPRLLKHHEDPTAITIAPRYWARRSQKIWARPACYYPCFSYV